MTDGRRPEQNPLVERVDALLRRGQNGPPATRPDEDVPVLTEIVDPATPAGAPPVDLALVEAFANELENAVLLRLAPELDRLFEERLAGRLGEILDQVLNEMRAELSASVHQMVRDSIAASVAQALGAPAAVPGGQESGATK